MAPSNALRGLVVSAAACATLAASGGSVLRAQQPQLIGYVKADDADVTGSTAVLDGQAVLAGAAGVTAKAHTAVITLGRGGMARVCQTSQLHVAESNSTSVASNTASAAGTDAPPLLFSLERGAIEIQMNGFVNDSILTPDLRMTVRTNGPLDLRLRVARNGDTCVDNRGTLAPTLALTDPFGGSRYELMAGQHVMFEHGSLQEVVDHEREPCGCPEEQGASVAEALLAPSDAKSGAKTSTAPTQAHPFPEAVSAGLVPGAGETPAAEPQATDSLRYNGAAASGVGAAAASAATPVSTAATPSAQPAAAAPPAKPKKRGAWRRFFHAVFGS